MIRWIQCVFSLLVLALLAGCGNSASLEPAAEQDELSKWVEQNPAPPETPVD